MFNINVMRLSAVWVASSLSLLAMTLLGNSVAIAQEREPRRLEISSVSRSPLVAQAELPLAAAARPSVIARSASDEAISKKSRTERPLSLMITNKSIEVRPGDPSQGTIGYQQSIRVVGKPFTNSRLSLQNHELNGARASLRNLLLPNALDELIEDEGGLMEQSLACNREATVNVIAREITYGPSGPLVPVRLDYQMGQGGPKTGIGGGDLEVNVDYTFNYGFGGEDLILWGKMAYPSFAEPNLFDEVPNDHPNNAAILGNGDDLEDVLTAHQAQGPYGNQIDLTEILNDEEFPNSETDYLDDDGKIRLPANEFIVLYELGTRDQQSPAFDFNDLVLKVKTDCGVGSEVMLRDSIGEDNSSTNGNFSLSDFRLMPNGTWWITHIPIINPPVPLKIKEWRAIVAPNGFSNVNWAQYTYKVLVWSDIAAAQASPQNGNIANYNLSTVPPPPVFGVAGDPPGPTPVWSTYDLRFNISDLNITVSPGQSRVIAVQALTTSGSFGLLGILESSETGISDRQCGSPMGGSCMDVSSSGGSLHDGRLAVSILTESL